MTYAAKVESEPNEDLLSRLRPYLDIARGSGGEILGEVGSELTQKAAGGIASIGLKTVGAIHRAVRSRLAHAKARRRLDEELQVAASDFEREAAYRSFLSADPFLRNALAALLERRDYLLALSATCDDLPITDLVPGSYRLSDVFVEPKLLSIGDHRSIPSQSTSLALHSLLEQGNHIVFGDAGSGKSSLARSLTRAFIADLLNDEHALALDQLPLPVYVSAAELRQTNWARSLREAVDKQLGLRGISELSEDFFNPRAPHGHRLWTILVDGFDEIDDQARRQTVFNTVLDIQAREFDSFRFILFARPDGLSAPANGFAAWRLAPPLDVSLLIERYVKSAESQAKLKSLLKKTEYREIARNPFFVAMSAALINERSDLPSQPFALLEAFIERGLQNADRNDPGRREALLELLKEIAAHPKADVSGLLKSKATICASLSVASSAIRIQRDVERALRATGLVRVAHDGHCHFIHRLIDRHFLAETIAATQRPGADVWTKLDPMGLGWAAVEQLCVRWASTGAPTEEAISALAEYGNEALNIMLRLAIQLPSVSDAAFKKAYSSLYDELEEGITHERNDLLYRLAGARESVRHNLIQVVHASWYGFDLVPAAQALSRAGYFDSIREKLLEVVRDHEEGDPYTQNEVASILCENGFKKDGIKTFRYLSENAPDDWERLDAACRLYEASRTEENRQVLRDVVVENYVDGDAELSPWQLERVFEFGEVDLALPLLREAANLSDPMPNWWAFDRCIDAARILGKHDRAEGLLALESLLATPGISLRNQAELLAEIERLEPNANARERLVELVKATPLQMDWKVADVLAGLDLDATAWEAAKFFIRHQFGHRRFDYDARELLQRVALVAPPDEVEALIFEGLKTQRSCWLAGSLALIGQGAQARAQLEVILDDPDYSIRTDAALELGKVGGGALARRRLVKWATDRVMPASARQAAANALLSLGEMKSALAAYRKLVRDSTVEMSARCEAAVAYARVSGGNDEPVIQALGAAIKASDLTPSDRLSALKVVCDLDPYEDCFWGAEDWFWDIIKSGPVAPSDIETISQLIKELQIDVSEIPDLTALLGSNETDLTVRVNALARLRRTSSSEEFARAELEKIASDSSGNWGGRSKAIDALGREISGALSARVDALIEDQSVPPGWRLVFARRGAGYPSETDSTARRLSVIANDSSVAVHFRLEAFDGAHSSDRAQPFPDFTSVADLDILERVAIANAAHSNGLEAVAVEQFRAAMLAEPKGIAELVGLHRLSARLSETESTASLQKAIAEIPLSLMLHTDDGDAVSDAISIMGRANPDSALSRLTSLVTSDGLSIWDIPRIVDKMSFCFSDDEILNAVQPVIKEYINEFYGSEEKYVSMWALEPLYERGWIDDATPLIDFANDPARRFSERIGALALAFHANGSNSGRVRAILNRQLEEAPEDVSETALAAHNLLRQGFRADALTLARRCLSVSPISHSDRISLVRLFDEIGHSAQADELLSSAKVSDFQGIFLTSSDKSRLARHFGASFFDIIDKSKIDNSEDRLDGICAARDRVTEFGCRESLKFIHQIISDPSCDPLDRVEAIDALDQIGFREFSRSAFRQCKFDDDDPLWVAEQCVRFGWKAEARILFRQAITQTHQENSHLILAGLANIGAAIDLKHAEVALSRSQESSPQI